MSKENKKYFKKLKKLKKEIKKIVKNDKKYFKKLKKLKKEIKKIFKKYQIHTNYEGLKEKCKNCFAKFYCSGGCAANAYNFTGSINDVYELGCELQRKRVECAIMIKAAMAEQ